MGKATLVIMAAGMGSRYGGLKQVVSFGANGETLADYSIFDAKRAGFDRVVFIIKAADEALFASKVLSTDRGIETAVVFQQTDFGAYERVKPWGTGHAVACCRDELREPFCVINADDFYGASAYRTIFNHLTRRNQHCMAAYPLGQTLSDAGTVSRGVCTVKDGFLERVAEKTRISTSDGKIFNENNGKREDLSPDTYVSMNCWGFTAGFADICYGGFLEFLHNTPNIDKDEYYLPSVAQRVITEQGAKIAVLPTTDPWFGVTYPSDFAVVKEKIGALTRAGVYPEKLW